MDAKELMLALIRSGFTDTELPENIDEETLENAYSLALKHDMAHIVAAAPGKRANGEMTKQKMLAVYRREQLNFEEARIFDIFVQNGIDYIPLKGSVIKKYYPAEWMRTSSDIDVLVHPESVKKAVELLCRSLGYTCVGKSLKDHQLYSKSGVHLELHFSLECGNEAMDRVLARVWEYADPVSRRHELTDEFLVFHTVAHAQAHFAAGGCGVKPLLDLWVLNRSLKYNEKEFISLIKESGSEKFYDSFLTLMNAWFEGGKHTPLTEKAESYILCGGVYGTRENLGSASVHREGGRARYILSRIFKPRRALEAQYPNLKKYPILLPYYRIKRWFNLFDKNRRADAERELSGSMQSNGVAEMLRELGL